MALRPLLLRRGVRGTKTILAGGFSSSRCTATIINNNNNNNKSGIINRTIFFNPREYGTLVPPYRQHNDPEFLPACPFAGLAFQLKEMADVLKCAHFAVDFHNVQKDTKLQFQRLLSSGHEVVAGLKVFIMLEATDAADNLGSYLAIVYWQPWTDYKKLIHFGPVTW